MKDNKEVKFIADRYKKGLFAVEPALRRIRPVQVKWWTRSRIAAACIAVAVLTATAAVFVHNSYFSDTTPIEQEMQPSTLPAAEIVRVIDFEDASLPIVVEKIREIYGVEIGNIPANAEEYHLSLHYEGSAVDLVETINDILDVDMIVKER